MNSKTYTEKLNERLEEIGEGTPFVPSDFSDITGTQTIRKLLNLKVSAGELSRIIPGVYYQPRVSSLLNEAVPPDPDKAAQAIARSFGWTITADGETALNRLGLSTQVPAVWTYISDGPYRKYSLPGAALTFKHTTNKNIKGLSPLSRLLVQALKALGREKITNEKIMSLTKRLSPQDKEMLLNETTRITEWIREIIVEICGR